MKTVITVTKGDRITVPLEILRRYYLHEGDMLIAEEYNDYIKLVPVKKVVKRHLENSSD